MCACWASARELRMWCWAKWRLLDCGMCDTVAAAKWLLLSPVTASRLSMPAAYLGQSDRLLLSATELAVC